MSWASLGLSAAGLCAGYLAARYGQKLAGALEVALGIVVVGWSVAFGLWLLLSAARAVIMLGAIAPFVSAGYWSGWFARRLLEQTLWLIWVRREMRSSLEQERRKQRNEQGKEKAD